MSDTVLLVHVTPRALGGSEVTLRSEADGLRRNGWRVVPLARRLPTVVTAHVPMCTNGARYLDRRELACERPVGVQ